MKKLLTLSVLLFLSVQVQANELSIKFTERPELVNTEILPLANGALKKDASLKLTMSLTSLTLRANAFWTGRFKPSSSAQDECGAR